MTVPEEAVARAQEAAAEARARGGYRESPLSLDFDVSPRIRDQRLIEWATIEPNHSFIGSTRRLGAPITAIKRGLLRLLRQYNDQVLAQQTRFNAHVAAHVISFDDRLDAMERLLGESEQARERQAELNARREQ